ncbi:MAG: FHA domain-containing protein [Deltaproteobacteria bacterium]|nr:FHA domain-containing protein [Deltaproteobacteria bacterium]
MRIDETLYQSTLQIRQELELILDRIEKMELHSSEVSEQVYQRVKKDYLVQLGKIKSGFEQKCTEIEKALQELYAFKGEQESYLQKNREIFEEAKFRHVLGEYQEEKFQEVKIQTETEIANYEKTLSELQKQLDQYEELIQVRDKLSELPSAPIPEKPSPTPTSPPTPVALKEATPPPASTARPPSSPKQASGDYFLNASNPGGDYFNEDEAVVQPTPPAMEKKKVAAPPPAAGPELSFDDSISAILKSIPLEELEAKEAPEVPAPVKSTPPQETKKPSMEEDPPTGKQTISILEEAPELPEMPEMEEESVSIHAKLICLEGDVEPKEIELSETISLGRSPSNDVVLKEAKVSRQHAAINKQGNDYILIDLKSSNGVYVNGKRVEEQILKDGDQVSVGSFKMLFQRF